jgi:hypothetical protein
MDTFAPGDRVVAINTDLSFPLRATGLFLREIHLPDGPLRENIIYHVKAVKLTSDGLQGLYITGLSAFYGTREIAFHYSRFRKVDFLRAHAPKKRRRKVPAPLLLTTP